MKISEEIQEKLLFVYEKKLIKVIIPLILIFPFAIHFCVKMFPQTPYLNKIDFFITEKIIVAFFNLESSLMSISGILIGIYFAVFTMLLTIKKDSIISKLSKDEFKDLIVYIRNAFMAALIYVLLIIITEVVSDQPKTYPYILGIIIGVSVIYLFLTGLRFGVVMYTAFLKDLKNTEKNQNEITKKEREFNDLKLKLKRFLNDYEKEKDAEQNTALSEKIREDKKKKSH